MPRSLKRNVQNVTSWTILPDKKGANCLDECSDDEFFIGCITSGNCVDTSKWCKNRKIEGKVVKVQLDTGAKVNVIFT